jgi:predicted alpha/beta-fold hydrolase
MRFLSSTSSDGVREQLFTLGGIPGVLWTPDGGEAVNRPLVLLGHGGGRHKKDPEISALAHRLVTECGHAAVCVDVPAHGDRPEVEEYDRLAAENQAAWRRARNWRR